MASIAQQLPDTLADRRTVPRAEVSLGVTLHRVGEAQVIPAAIANLSATGFLADLPDGASVPDMLDVDLPNAGRRTAQVVWQSGSMAGCTFTTPLRRSDISAARLKSDHSAAPAPQAPALSPADPIWDLGNVATAQEKWPLKARFAVIAGLGAIPWISFATLAAMLA